MAIQEPVQTHVRNTSNAASAKTAGDYDSMFK